MCRVTFLAYFTGVKKHQKRSKWAGHRREITDLLLHMLSLTRPWGTQADMLNRPLELRASA